MFIRNNEIHTYNTRNADNLAIPIGRLSLVDKSIRYIIPDIYNSMPSEIKPKTNTHSIGGFSRYARNFLLDKYPLDCTLVNCPSC